MHVIIAVDNRWNKSYFDNPIKCLSLISLYKQEKLNLIFMYIHILRLKKLKLY